jgi:hypothetical protein
MFICLHPLLLLTVSWYDFQIAHFDRVAAGGRILPHVINLLDNMGLQCKGHYPVPICVKNMEWCSAIYIRGAVRLWKKIFLK